MLKVKCIQKFKKNNKIYGYRLQDAQGNTKDVYAEQLKQAIRNQQITVINLTLTSDNRLMDTTPEQLKAKNNSDNNRIQNNTTVRYNSKEINSKDKKEPIMPRSNDNDTFNLKYYIERNGVLLSNEENIALTKRIQSGDKSAETEFVINNGKLVSALIKKRFPMYTDNDDVFQQGLLGLLDGASKYDESYGTTISTHCYYWIRQRIQRYLIDKESAIRLPVHFSEKVENVKILRDKFNKESDTDKNSRAELTKYILLNMPELDEKDLIAIFQYMDGVTSLNKPVGENEHGEISELGDFLSDVEPHEESSQERDFLNKERRDIIDTALRTVLKDKELEVIKRRYGLGCEVETLEEIGKSFGVSRERIRQIEDKALEKLRKSKYCSVLKEYT